MSTATNGRRGGWLGALAWLALIVAVLAAAATAASGPGYQAGWWGLRTALATILPYAGMAALGAAGVALLLAVVFLFRGPGRLLVPSMLAVLISGGLLAIMVPQAVKVRDVPVFSALLGAEKVPYIHDITTDTEDPPQFSQSVIDLRQEECEQRCPPPEISGTDAAAVQECRKRACNPPEYDPEQGGKQKAFAGYADIEPAYFDAPPDVIFDRALKVVKKNGWDVIGQNRDAGIIEASETSTWFGFTDDVVIRIREAEDGRTRVDMRSKSRIGGSDVGVNAERIRRFMAKLQKA